MHTHKIEVHIKFVNCEKIDLRFSTDLHGLKTVIFGIPPIRRCWA